jgi:hypothetical protein
VELKPQKESPLQQEEQRKVAVQKVAAVVGAAVTVAFDPFYQQQIRLLMTLCLRWTKHFVAAGSLLLLHRLFQDATAVVAADAEPDAGAAPRLVKNCDCLLPRSFLLLQMPSRLLLFLMHLLIYHCSYVDDEKQMTLSRSHLAARTLLVHTYGRRSYSAALQLLVKFSKWSADGEFKA